MHWFRSNQGWTMTRPTAPGTSVVFDNNDGALMRRLELNFRGVNATCLDPWSLAMLRRRKFVSLADGLATMTELGSRVFQECEVVNPESHANLHWTMSDARLAELGVVLNPGRETPLEAAIGSPPPVGSQGG